MDFTLKEEQVLLKESVGKWCRDNYSFATRSQVLASHSQFDTPFWKVFAEMGWLSVPFDEVDGGYSGGPQEMMLLMEEFGRALLLEPYLATVILGGGILKHANDSRSRKLIPKIVAGDLKLALAFVEPQSGYNLADISTRALTNAGGYILNGQKIVALGADSADLIVVPARTEGRQTDPVGVTLFLLDPKTHGIEIENYQTQDGFSAADVKLRDVFVSSDSIVGELNQGLGILKATIDDATFAVSAEAVGIMDCLLESTVEFSKTRNQFGSAIGSFQALQFKMADMYNECQQARSIVLSVCVDHEKRFSHLPQSSVAACKAYIGIAGKIVGENAVQIHGAIGLTDELDVSHYFKRLTMINVLFGDTDHQIERYQLSAAN
jgi:alkylation response protein AidB-like acyl-CoA dehydrogenase